GICLAPPSSRFIRPLRHSLISFTHFREPAASVFAQSTVSHPSGGLFRSYTCLLPHAQVIWHSSASFRKRCRQAKTGTNSFGFVFSGTKLAPIYPAGAIAACHHLCGISRPPHRRLLCLSRSFIPAHSFRYAPLRSRSLSTVPASTPTYAVPRHDVPFDPAPSLNSQAARYACVLVCNPLRLLQPAPSRLGLRFK